MAQREADRGQVAGTSEGELSGVVAVCMCWRNGDAQ